MKVRHLAALALMLLAAAVAAGCGGDDSSTEPPQELEDSLGFGSGDQAKEIQARVENRIADCMKAQGFEYTPVDPFAQQQALTGKARITDEEFTRQFGYGISTLFGKGDEQSDPNDRIRRSLAEADRAAYDRALYGENVGVTFAEAVDTGDFTELGGCTKDASEAAFGGAALVWLGAAAAFLSLAGVDAWLRGRRKQTEATGLGYHAALLVAIGIGLHNLGEGVAIGSAYATGALALGAFLVVGFAIHNTTEGLAIVAPLRDGAGAGARARLGHLAALGLIAGAPAILGAWIGAAAFNPSLAALLFGVGVGAIARVIVQIAPAMRDGDGRLLHPLSVAGLLAGIAVLYLTGLLFSV